MARSLLDTLKAVSEDERDCIAVLERVSRLADDSGRRCHSVLFGCGWDRCLGVAEAVAL